MTAERELYREKKSRDQLLNQMKKEVERRREPTERYERRVLFTSILLLLIFYLLYLFITSRYNIIHAIPSILLYTAAIRL